MTQMEVTEVASILDFTDQLSAVLSSSGSDENTSPNLPLHLQNRRSTSPSDLDASLDATFDATFGASKPVPTPPLPNLIVVGDQSSGKSSLLCKLSSFPPSVLFPVAAGRCTTRCATKLILRTSASATWTAKVSTSLNPKACKHVKGDMDELKRAIDVARSQVESGSLNSVTTESSISIGENSIHFGRQPSLFTNAKLSAARFILASLVALEIHSSSSPNISLIDLPGLVRTTVSGQSPTIVSDIDSLTDHYMANPNNIILAVIPANVDVATVDVLERARIVDPEGVRTVGVLTKADLVQEEGYEEVLGVLRNETKPLRLGYYLINSKIDSVTSTFVDERAFFTTHPAFSSLPAGSTSLASLSSTLTQMIAASLLSSLGAIKSHIDGRLTEAKIQMAKSGIQPPSIRGTYRTQTVVTPQRQLVQATKTLSSILSSSLLHHPRTVARVRERCGQHFKELSETIESRSPDFSKAEEVEGLREGEHGRSTDEALPLMY